MGPWQKSENWLRQLTLQKPYLIKFPKIGTEDKGYLVPFEHLPFPVAHVYCIGPVPENESRGNHAKKNSAQVIVPIGGTAIVRLESPEGEVYEFKLISNDEGLFIPPGYWRSAQLSQNCYLIGLHSMKFSEDDYVRDYEQFKTLNHR